MSTQVTDSHNGLFRTAGQTFWACRSADGQAGMAWDWVELGQGVIAMADPLSVMTNLRFLDPDGGVLGRYEALGQINTLVHDLPWQQQVGEFLDTLAADLDPEHRTVQRPGAWQRRAEAEPAGPPLRPRPALPPMAH